MEERELNYCGDLLIFLRGLSAQGFNVGLDHHLAVQRLLINLAARGALPASPLDLPGLLTPIICSSPEEQRTFRFLFEEWMTEQCASPEMGGKHTREDKKTSSAHPKDQHVRIASTLRRSPTWYWFIRLLSVISLLVSILGLFRLFNNHYTRPTSSQTRLYLSGVINDGKGSPLIGSVVKVSEEAGIFFIAGLNKLPERSTNANNDGTYKLSLDGLNFPLTVTAEHKGYLSQSTKVDKPTDSASTNIHVDFALESDPGRNSLNWEVLAKIVAGLLLILLFFKLALIARRLHLKRWRTANNLHIQNLTVKGAEEHLTQMLSLRRTAQNLRHYRQDISQNLDVDRTIESSIRTGAFTPVYSTIKSSPEYLILINRSSPDDQVARMENETIHRLAKNGVYIDRYYFKKDPRLCWKEGRGNRSYTLPELAATHPRHSLVIFDNGSAFFDPITGSPHGWLAQFYNWPERVVLTPEFRAGEYIEKELSDFGFLVLPATSKGIAALGEVASGGFWRNSVADNASPLPQLLRVRPARWLEDHPPSMKVLGELRVQLKDFLGEEGYYWLCACAVYPMLNWDLTLYLGYTLLDYHQVDNGLLQLLRLPWFPHGGMPDWMREALLAELTAKQETEIRQTLEDLLKTSLLNPDGFVLPIARKRKLAESDLFKSPLREIKKRAAVWREKLFVRDYIISESKESPLRDRVFVSFMYGIRRDHLAFLLPKELHAFFIASASRDPVDSAVRAFMSIVLMIPFVTTIYSAYTEGSFIIFVVGTCLTAFIAFLYIYGERTMFSGVDPHKADIFHEVEGA